MERYVSNAAAAAGTSKTLLNLFQNAASPTVRLRLYEVILGCGQATADATAEYYVGRTTAQGTAGSSFTPNNVDEGGPAGQASAGQGVFSVEPTYTAAKDLLWLPCHQRNTLRWIVGEGSEIIVAATQNHGLGLRSNQATSTANYRGQFSHKE